MFKTPFSSLSDDPFYLIVDGSVIDNVGAQICLLDAKAEAYALFSHTDYEELLPASPWIVQCTIQTETLFQWLEQHQYFSNAAWLCQSAYPMERLVAHFKSLLIVDVYGQDTFFRFSDPRVMYALAHEHSQQQILSVIAPFSALWFKSYQRWVSVDIKKQRESSLTKYVVSDRDIEIFQWVANKRMTERLDEYIKEKYPHWHTLNPKINAQQVIAAAGDHGITTEKGVYLYTSILGVIGQRALQENHYPQLLSLLTTASLYTAEQRVEKAAMMVQQHHKGITS